MSHTHLSQVERYQIYALHKVKQSARQIAGVLNRHHTTISRELRRNAGERGYRAKQADAKAVLRGANSRNAKRISHTDWKSVELFLRFQHSPEQIAHRLGLHHQSIYAYIKCDRQAGGVLWKQLRGANKRRKRYGSGISRQGQIPNKRSIQERPAHIELRSQVGHWEVDTIIGANHKQVIVSIVERKTGFVLLKKAACKSADAVERAVCAMLKPYANKVKTITSDNGKEFAHHQTMAKELKARWFFADPYCSWQRGSNENTNGLVRQYVPKKTKLESVSDEDIARFEALLNCRPRKRLGYKTPECLFFQSLRRGAFRN
jgi:transposase, IS30 family